MAVTKSFGYPTPTLQDVGVDQLAYANDFALQEQGPRRTVLTNTKNPTDQPETLRYEIQNIANIYSGTGIVPSYVSPSTRGFSLVAQVNDILRVTDSADPKFIMDLPISAHVVLKGALSSYILENDYLSVALRAVGALYETDSSGKLVPKVAKLVRGSLTPAGL